jgi:hypothetical protein
MNDAQLPEENEYPLLPPSPRYSISCSDFMNPKEMDPIKPGERKQDSPVELMSYNCETVKMDTIREVTLRVTTPVVPVVPSRRKKWCFFCCC